MFLWMSLGWMAVKRCFQPVQPRYLEKTDVPPKTSSKWKESKNYRIFFWCFVFSVLFWRWFWCLWNNKTRNITYSIFLILLEYLQPTETKQKPQVCILDVCWSETYSLAEPESGSDRQNIASTCCISLNLINSLIYCWLRQASSSVVFLFFSKWITTKLQSTVPRNLRGCVSFQDSSILAILALI